MDLLITVAAILVIVSLALAWVASLTLYLKIPALVKVFPSAFQLVRAHIDYLLMAMLLGVFVLLGDRQGVSYAAWLRWMMVIGAVYNPLGFVVLATRTERGPKPGFETWATLVGFIPATLGFGGAAVVLLANL